ncbi:bile acid:sodium symporter family protein [Hoeflea sp. YIM 152468]|uniref:bile acid:sodium symporter family protein n=1 Tax=Hoeflea sp. YIM 152468 TaxID=3031759 RepID=UPI0023DB6456|nr:bile acid:sodium symporter family protein [Hoeflea sp. YIM 152468]MDF1609456.1 bile acid:sodium symporter family protein [Hoeflea sp. YIM 152468]
MGTIVGVVLPLGLAFIMLSLGLGLTVADFARVAKQPFAFVIGAVNQVVILPVVTFALVLAFGLGPELAIGFMILAFCPGGVTSNILTRLARGDVALSVSLTAVISLASMITVPPLLALAIRHFSGAEAPPVNISGIAVQLFLLTTVPILLGLTLRHLAPAFTDRIAPVVAQVANGLFVFIVVLALVANWDVFVANLPVLAPSLVSLILLLLAIGYGVARLAAVPMAQVKTIAIETGIQNSTLGITVAAMLSGYEAGFSAYALPAAVYGILMYVVSAPLILWLRRVDAPQIATV